MKAERFANTILLIFIYQVIINTYLRAIVRYYSASIRSLKLEKLCVVIQIALLLSFSGLISSFSILKQHHRASEATNDGTSPKKGGGWILNVTHRL
jgi:hypothetical protein